MCVPAAGGLIHESRLQVQSLAEGGGVLALPLHLLCCYRPAAAHVPTRLGGVCAVACDLWLGKERREVGGDQVGQRKVAAGPQLVNKALLEEDVHEEAMVKAMS